ncbi:hypothetical protein M0R45_020146 [Rubus argutus]|uniref:Uncharacterized protein n=1 Tax=Rubus argutus TaxID=59490 RepID=A0AAW1XAV4_RUBAR
MWQRATIQAGARIGYGLNMGTPPRAVEIDGDGAGGAARRSDRTPAGLGCGLQRRRRPHGKELGFAASVWVHGCALWSSREIRPAKHRRGPW